jgi:hypothetical protein
MLPLPTRNPSKFYFYSITWTELRALQLPGLALHRFTTARPDYHRRRSFALLACEARRKARHAGRRPARTRTPFDPSDEVSTGFHADRTFVGERQP